ncbi:MAG: VWA domain-containing protein [Planctomycetes bacterium]|nr:VWA domain-containing protein [Planctomycetota bacterium]
MKLESPEMLYLLLLIPLYALLKYLLKAKGGLSHSEIRSIKLMPKTWRIKLMWLPSFLTLLAFMLFIFVLSKPAIKETEQRDYQTGIAIEMLVDISSSMDMNISYEGKKSTRMEVAKKVVEEFVAGDDNKLKGRKGDLIGIITFARYADTVCPLTLSHEALVYMAREMDINDQPNEDGTAYGDAAALAAARLSQYEELMDQEQGLLLTQSKEISSKVIILLTDGENNCGLHLPMEAASMAKEWNIRIYTISLGDASSSENIKTKEGNFKVSGQLSEAEWTLKKMAESTGGIFRKAHDYDSLQAVYTEIDRLEKSDLAIQKYSRFNPYYTPFLLAAFLLFISAALLENTYFRRVA